MVLQVSHTLNKFDHIKSEKIKCGNIISDDDNLTRSKRQVSSSGGLFDIVKLLAQQSAADPGAVAGTQTVTIKKNLNFEVLATIIFSCWLY